MLIYGSSNLELDFGNGDMLRHVRATWGEESLACEPLCTLNIRLLDLPMRFEVYRVIVFPIRALTKLRAVVGCRSRPCIACHSPALTKNPETTSELV